MKLMLAFPLLLAACTTYTMVGGTTPDDASPVVDDDTGTGGTTDDTGEAVDPVWDTARLDVVSPTSGSFIPLGEAAGFEAHVEDAEGNVLDFEDITWSSDADADWAPVGTSFTDASLGVGRHDLTAEERLPNGDRLAHTVGDILVQSPYAGTYTGTLYVTITFSWDGTPYTTSCAGAATVVVAPEGDVVTGDSSCLVSLMGYYDLDMTFNIEAENADGEVAGEVAADLGFFDYGLDSTGSMTEDGELEMTFSDTISMYVEMELSGVLEVSRITRDTELDG